MSAGRRGLCDPRPLSRTKIVPSVLLNKSPIKEAVREFESSYIQQVLDDSENLKQAADRLGLSMSTLCRKKRQMALTKCHVKR